MTYRSNYKILFLSVFKMIKSFCIHIYIYILSLLLRHVLLCDVFWGCFLGIVRESHNYVLINSQHPVQCVLCAMLFMFVLYCRQFVTVNTNSAHSSLHSLKEKLHNFKHIIIRSFSLFDKRSCKLSKILCLNK